MIPTDLTYDLPEVAYLLLLTPILLWMFWRLYVYRQDRLTRTALPDLIFKRSTPLFWLRSLFFLLSWIFAVFALMQPKGNERYPQGAQNNSQQENVSLKRKGHDIILLIDASASMAIPDARNKTARLDDAKEIADEIISKLKGENVAVYAFTSQPTQLSPLTLDYLFARLMLKTIQINEGGVAGTDYTNILTKIRDEYFAHPSPHLKTVILISDGGDTLIQSLSGSEKEEVISKLLNLFQNAEALNLRVYTIGVGSRQGGIVPNVIYQGKAVLSKLDESLLTRISGKGRGQYYEANQLSIVDIINRINADMSQDSPFVDENTIQQSYSLSTDLKIYSYYYYWPLFVSLICLLLALFLPETSFAHWLPVFLLSTTILQADPLPQYAQDKMLDAAREAEAGAYSSAMDDYRSVADLPLEAWQRNILSYNEGTLLLNERKWTDAIQQLISIPDFKGIPLLKRRIHTNLAIAQLELAKETQDARKAQYLILRAQDSLNFAIKNDCELEKLEGDPTCPLPLDLDEIALDIRQLRSSILTKVQKEDIQNAPLAKGIAALYRGIDQLESHLRMEEHVDNNLKSNYQAFVVAEGDSWLPLWNTMKERISDPKLLATYEEARKLFAYAIRFVEKQKPNLSRGGIIEARQKLDDLVKMIWGADTFSVQLFKFADSLKEAILQDPLALTDLIAARDEVTRLLKINPDSGLEGIQKNINKAADYLKTNQQTQARMFSLFAQNDLRVKLNGAQKNPDDILRAAIEQQQNAVDLNVLFLQLDRDHRSDDLGALLKGSQQATLKAADPYLKAVQEEQARLYGASGACQCQPWNKVLPLFDEGYKDALQSHRQINDDVNESNLALVTQDQTIKNWQAALDQMNQKVQEEKQQQQKQPETKAEQQEQQDQLPSNTNQILQSIQDMQRADMKPTGPQKVTIQGVRPW